jgi:hypothetical protein
MALAVVSSAALGLWPAAAPAKNEEMAIKQEGQKQESALLFNEVSSKKGSTKDGAPFSSQLYQSSDGIEVTVTRENRDSAGRANKELQKKLKGSLRIIGRAPKLDEKRERVGERVVAIFAFDDSQKEQASVLWTNGQQFYYIESLSLKHALEFEKQFYR